MTEKKVERRKHARLPVLHEIDKPIQVALDSQKSVPGVLVDLSASGMSLLTYALVPVGSEINLAIDLPGLKTHPLKGRVVWTIQKGEMWRMGIAFNSIDPVDFRRINKMAIECSDCDTKLALGVTDPCYKDCVYFPLCTKPAKLKKKQ